MSKGNTLQEMLGNFSPIPLKGENFDEYYVDTYEARGNNPIKKIKLNLEYSLNPYFKVLFLGHTGSGKSTELYLLEEAVKEKFEVISFSILEEVDGMDLYFTDFVFAIMAQIIKYLDEGISCSQEALDALYDYWNKEKIIETVEIEESNAETGVGSKIGFLKMISLEGKGILKSGAQTKITTREKMEPKIGYLVQLINRVLNDINIQLKEKKGKELLIIIENIDHLEAKATTGLFIEHKISFLSLNVKMVLTCPIFLVYDKHYHMVKDDFDYVQLLNMIKVRDSSGNIFEKGIETIEKIIEKRTELSLFEEGTLKFLILKSGGTLRDLFQMIREAAIEAICNERETIYQEDAEIAYRNLKSEYTRLIRTDEDIKALKEIYYDPKPSRTDGIMESLLLRGLIIEYNGERWCGIHPAVKDFLEEKGEL